MELKDVLKFYLGCEVLLESKMYGVGGKPDKIRERLVGIDENGAEGEQHILYEGDFKLILRPLSSMTEEEALEFARIERPEAEKVKLKDGKVWSYHDPKDGTFYKWLTHSLETITPKQFVWLCKKGFDLWNLIESNQAINHKTEQ